MSIYRDAVASASEKVFVEFEPFLCRLEPDEARYGRDSVVDQIISLLEKERPPNPKTWADKQLRNGMTQFLISRGHALEDLIKAQKERAASRPNRRAQPNAVDLVTEDLVAMQFANAHSGGFRYCHDAGSWHEWNGSYWIKDRLGRVSDIVRGLAREMSRGEEPKVRYAAGKASFVSGVERHARTDGRLAVTSEFWDSDSMLLGTPKGTVDLISGRLHPSAQDEGITKLTAVAPADTADSPIWLSFLNDATGGDKEMIRFLQQWCGYCLTGDVSEHAFVFLYGGGGNGKTVFLNTVSRIIGGYHATAPMETFTASNGDRHPTDVAGLRGARLVAASETEEGRAWAEAKIKSMTGGDPITARFMRQDFFTYRPQFKLTVVGNHKPRLKNVDEAMRRRVNIVPFIRKPANPDPRLEQRLQVEWPWILRWMIDGCLDWQKNRLLRPRSVALETDHYFEDQDLFQHWLDERCDAEPDNPYKKTTSTDLFRSWSEYAKGAGIEPGVQVSFGEKLRNAGFGSYRSNSERGWTGIGLRASTIQFSKKDDQNERTSTDYEQRSS
jgi:putative DNA primase/helicase